MVKFYTFFLSPVLPRYGAEIFLKVQSTLGTYSAWLSFVQPEQSSRVRRRSQIRIINYFIIPPVSRDDGALHIFFYRPSCLDTVPKILANTRRTIVRLYRGQNTRENTKIIESRNIFFDKIINIKPQFCMTCVETHNCASLLHLFQPKQSSRVRRQTQIRFINYFIMPPVSRDDGKLHISFLPVLPRYGAENYCKYKTHNCATLQRPEHERKYKNNWITKYFFWQNN
jgi:hypothetical protein